MEVCGGRVGADFFEENLRGFADSILVNQGGSMCKLYLVSLEEFDRDWGLTVFVAGSMGRAFNPSCFGCSVPRLVCCRAVGPPRDYCLSKTRTWVNCLPAPLMPVMVTVIVLPRWVKTVRPVAR